jgi:hypothetical protein
MQQAKIPAMSRSVAAMSLPLSGWGAERAPWEVWKSGSALDQADADWVVASRVGLIQHATDDELRLCSFPRCTRTVERLERVHDPTFAR